MVGTIAWPVWAGILKMLFVMTILFWVAVYIEGRPVFWAGLAAIAAYYALKGWWDGACRTKEDAIEHAGKIVSAVFLWGAPVVVIYLARLSFGGHG